MTYPAAKDIKTVTDSVRIYKQLMKTKKPRKENYPYLFRALELEPDHPEANFLKGQAILDYHFVQWSEAIECFNKVIQSGWKRRLVWALTLKGSVLIHLDRFLEAREVLKQALGVSGKQHMYLQAFFGNKLYFRLTKELLRAGMVKALEGSAFQALSRRFREDEVTNKAITRLFQKYNEFSGFKRMGDEAIEKKDWKKAVQHYDEALKVARGNTVFLDGYDVYILQHQMHEFLKEPKKSGEIASQMVARFHYHKIGWRFNGLRLLRLKQYKSALESFNRALELGDDHIGMWGGKATALIELKRYSEAVDCIDQILKIDPDHEEAKKMKATLETVLK